MKVHCFLWAGLVVLNLSVAISAIFFLLTLSREQLPNVRSKSLQYLLHNPWFSSWQGGLYV